MSSQVFYLKYRSQTLTEVVGQEPVTRTLQNALNSGRISHAYLFCGPRGTGKTSTARILAKAVNCLSEDEEKPCNKCVMCQSISEVRALDVIEIDAASNNGVDDVRSLREKVNYAPNQARYKVYIIDEVHMLSTAAANALLKTLEEPPPHVIFILATTEAHKILPTILSRCQRFDFRRIPQEDVISRLSYICQQEGITIDTEGLKLIARSATGSLRDAINTLEQLTTYYGAEVGLEQVKDVLGITGDWRAKELVKQIIHRGVSAGVSTINNVNNDGLDLRQFNREMVEYLRALLLIKTGSEGAVDLITEDVADLKELAGIASLEQILRAVRLFGEIEFGFDHYPTLPMELALVDCVLGSGEQKVKLTDVAPIPAASQKSVPSVAPPVTKAPEPTPVEEIVPREIVKEIPAQEPEPQPVTESEPEFQPITEHQPESEPQPVAEPEPEPEPESQPVEEVKPEPVEATAPPVSPDTGDGIERLKANWKQVIEQAPPDTKKSSAIAILRSAGITPMSIDNGTVVLSFRHNNHKELMEKMENQKVAEQIISSYLGYPCKVNCVFDNNPLLKAALKMGAQFIDEEGK